MPNFTMQPNEQLDLPIVGEYLYIESGKVQVTVQPAGQTYDLQERDKIKVSPYEHLTIVSRSEAVQTVSIRAGLGDFIPAGHGKEVSVVGGVSIKEPVDLAAGTKLITMPAKELNDHADLTIPPLSRKRLVAANDRQKLIIQIDASELVLCRVGSAGVSAGRGMRIYGGDGQIGTLTLDLSGEIWAYNEHGSVSAQLSIVELVE